MFETDQYVLNVCRYSDGRTKILTKKHQTVDYNLGQFFGVMFLKEGTLPLKNKGKLLVSNWQLLLIVVSDLSVKNDWC